MKYVGRVIMFFALVSSSNVLFAMNGVVKEEKPVVVVICSYNNSKWTKDTLDSVFSQDYTNFRLIIVDDCSSDGNQLVIQNYIDDNHLADRVTFIQNSKRYRKLYNLYRVLYMCNDQEIVVMLDGDDFFANSQVLSQLSSMYDDADVWFTYGQYKNVPASQAVLWGHREMGYCREVPKHIQRKHAYRYYSFIYMHPRSFRAWLFKLVKLEDLIADKIQGFAGDFYPASNDVAMYFPMVEMAHTHIRFISDVLYIRNLYSDIVGFKVDRKIQVASAREIRKKASYPILFKPELNRLAGLENAQADVFIICNYSLLEIETILDSLQKKISGLGTIHVFFVGTVENKTLCRKLRRQYPNFLFISYNASGDKLLKNKFLECLGCCKNEHIIVASNDFEVIESMNVSELIYWLEKTYAHRFFLSRHTLKKGVPSHVAVTDDICAWKNFYSTNRWQGTSNGDDLFLCRKSDLVREAKNFKFDTSYGLIREMHVVDPLASSVGLFFKEAKIKPII
jgi:glycosyltransferase involved in cell wall biosynthesis